MSAEVEIENGSLKLKAILHVPRLPQVAHGIIVFAHGSGSGRLSPRNQFVSETLNRSGFATLLADLLTEQESRDRGNVFDIQLMTSRVLALLDWLNSEYRLRSLPVGLFGASTGAAAALSASVVAGERVKAVVCRGGRPDLAGDRLARVRAPTLLVVGQNDGSVVELNRQSYENLVCVRRLEIIPNATHLFEEPGALEFVADLAAQWFHLHLTSESKRQVDQSSLLEHWKGSHL